jgi:glutathione S-transferase
VVRRRHRELELDAVSLPGKLEEARKLLVRQPTVCVRRHARSVLTPDYAVDVLLYNSAVSGNCYKVRLLLAHLGVEYETEELSVVDRSNRSEVLGALNPGLRVPTLVLDDGRPLAESNAILWYFGDGTRYVPDDAYERAQVLQWQFFEQYSHEPNIAVARFWKTYSGQPEKFERQRERLLAGGYAALAAMERHFDGRTFFVADEYSLADISLYAYTHVAHEGDFDLASYPAIGAWLERVAAQPGHVPIDA